MDTAGTAFDALVIGSGIGGMGAAAALSKAGKRVLVLERHHQLGGLTQSFTRGGYTFGPGVHCVGGAGGAPGIDGRFGRLLDWLTDGRLGFANLGSPYDILRFPDFEFDIAAPEAEFVSSLKREFPAQGSAIDAYLKAAASADAAVRLMLVARTLPAPISGLIRMRNAARLQRALGRTTERATSSIRDARLVNVLTARWALCGLPPSESPLASHALTTRSLNAGAFYPVGGPGKIAETLGATIVAAGGELRARCDVREIRVVDGRAVGVRLATGELIDAPVVISAMGAHNTVAALPATVAPGWRAAVLALEPSVTYIGIYLGFNGDIRESGATSANEWIYSSGGTGGLWTNPGHDPISQLFILFPSLRDPSHTDGQKHTAEGIVLCPWEPFARWADSSPDVRPPEYKEYKARIEQAVRAAFDAAFPRLAPMVDFCEISTPLTQAWHTAAPKGAMFGMGMSAKRLKSPALRVSTPVPGLLLGGQDAGGPGLQAALIGGYMAAASLEPSLWKRLK